MNLSTIGGCYNVGYVLLLDGTNVVDYQLYLLVGHPAFQNDY